MPFEKKASEHERRAYDLFTRTGIPIPSLLAYDEASQMLSLEDLRETYISGNDAPEQVSVMLDAAANLHAVFWDNYDAFGQVRLPWRLEHPKNFARHCKAMEKHARAFCKAHRMDDGVFRQAMAFFREEMPRAIDARFHTGKNITVIHGDLHPGNMLFPKGDEGPARFVDLEAVRMGLGAEDLAMLLALHIAPEKEQALPLLKYYYTRLCEKVQGYAFETLLEDYRIALAEALFFPARLFCDAGIQDTTMKRNAITAWHSFSES